LQLDQASLTELKQLETKLLSEYGEFNSAGLNLDLTRGKPSAEQLGLSNALLGGLHDDFLSEDGTDTRNYGGLAGIPDARRMGAELLSLTPAQVMAGDNSSLTVMYQTFLFSYLFGPGDNSKPWQSENAKFLCFVPGYDRHFSICEEFGVEMVNVPMTDTGPDMDQVEALVREDNSIKGMWCVPKYSNPTGVTYSDETVQRLAKLGQMAPKNFRIFWDNAYAVHDIANVTQPLANLMEYCKQFGTEDSVFLFASTSKISFAGAGISFLGASEKNLTWFQSHYGILSIGPNKVNQLRHSRFFPTLESLKGHMQKHAEFLRPRFACALEHLKMNFANSDLVVWEEPEGGYFISVDTRPGLAKQIVAMAADVGVKLTPAGATFPYRRDPQDRNIRLAPSVPTLEQVDEAMKVFVNCTKLASVREAISSKR